MHVLIDCRFADTGTGLGHYARHLVSALLKRTDGIQYSLLVRDTSSDWLKGLPATIIPCDIPHYSLAEQTALPRVIKKSGAHLFYALHFNVPWNCPIPFVTTIHDLILHDYPNSAPALKRAAYKVLMHRTVRRAKKIITVSDFVKRELARAYGASILKKTERIYEGVPDQFVKRSLEEQKNVRKKYDLAKEFFLYVGNAKQHKNVQMLIDAYAHVANPEEELILVSGGKEVDGLRLANGVRVLRDVPDADLPALYSAAKLFVTPSLYEGFGLPPLEALHCECPVIAVGGGAVEEIVGEFGTFLEPTREALTEALTNPPLERPKLPNRWTWQETARLTALLLRDTM